MLITLVVVLVALGFWFVAELVSEVRFLLRENKLNNQDKDEPLTTQPQSDSASESQPTRYQNMSDISS